MPSSNGTVPHLTPSAGDGHHSTGVFIRMILEQQQTHELLLCADLSGVGTGWALCNHP